MVFPDKNATFLIYFRAKSDIYSLILVGIVSIVHVIYDSETALVKDSMVHGLNDSETALVKDSMVHGLNDSGGIIICCG